MPALYVKNGKLYATDYLEIHIPLSYFENDRFASIKGATIESLGLVYLESFPDGNPKPITLLNLPAILNFEVYETSEGNIDIKNISIPVKTLKYMKDAYVMNASIERGREVCEAFLNVMLSGKLPKNLDYSRLIDIWWKNIEIAGVNLGVPSKIFEMIIANIYRDRSDIKKRFAEYYGSSPDSNGFNYQTGNVRKIVEKLSTFSGLAFEDISTMITSGINNSKNNVEEKESPIEKIIYY